MAAVLAALAAAMVLPYLPGRYDGLAQTVSMTAQLLGVVGLLLVPVGSLWLVYEARMATLRTRDRPPAGGRRYFAAATLAAGSVVAMGVALAAVGNERLSFGVLALAMWLYTLKR